MAEKLLHFHFKKPDTGSALVGEYNKNNKRPNRKPNSYFNRNKQGSATSTTKKEENKFIKKCSLCQKGGHWRSECRHNDAVTASIHGSNSSSSRSSKKEHKGEAIIAEVNLNSAKLNEWIVDSGATEHMTFNKDSFTQYETLSQPKTVKFGDNNWGEGIGIGVIKVETEEAVEFSLTNVLYVPQLRRKLLSISAATKLGAKGIITNNSILLKSKKGNILFEAKEKNGLYRLNLKETIVSSPNEEADLISESSDNLTSLHERFGHANKATLEKMLKVKSVLGLDNFTKRSSPTQSLRSEIDCEACLRGKQTKRNYPTSSRIRATKVGERLHTDMVGPICSSVSGKLYFCLFKDEYSNFRTIYFIKGKDEFLDSLQKCVSKIKSDTGVSVRKLFSDHATELTSNKAKSYLVANNIVHEMSAPFCPKQNGFIERDVRTILEYTRTMLLSRKLPQELWGEAANAAVYLLNRLVNSNTGNKTPYELYYGKKPDCKNLRVFGSLVSLKRQQKLRSGYQKKMETRSDPMVLVGYEDPGNYRVYDPINKKVIITPEIKIDENKGYNFDNNSLNNQSIYVTIDEIISGSDSEDINHQDDGLDDNLNPNSSSIWYETEQHDCATPDTSTPTNAEDTSQRVDDSADTETDDLDERINEPAAEPTQVQQSDQKNLSDNAETSNVTRRYPDRQRNKVNRYQPEAHLSEALIIYGDEPTSFDEAIRSTDSHEWRKAMKKEYDSLTKLNTWTLTVLPEGRKTIKCRWVYKKKHNSKNQVERYRARLVAKGFSQKQGIDYTETFSPVVRMDTIRFLLAYAAKADLNMVHFDVTTAFLYGQLQETIYMDQPPGSDSKKNLVRLLNKSIYGLKQSSRVWNICFTTFPDH